MTINYFSTGARDFSYQGDYSYLSNEEAPSVRERERDEGPSIYKGSGSGKGLDRFNDEVKDMINEARDVARLVSNPHFKAQGSRGYSSASSSRGRGSSYSFSPSFTYSTISHNYVPSKGESEGKKNDVLVRVVLGVLAGAVTLGASHLTGRTLGNFNKARKGLERIRSERENLKEYRERPRNNSDVKKIEKLLQKETEILERKKQDAMIGLALQVTAITGATFALLGAVLGGALLVPFAVIGGVTILTALCGMLIKGGFSKSDDSDLQDAKQIQRTVKDLENSEKDPSTRAENTARSA